MRNEEEFNLELGLVSSSDQPYVASTSSNNSMKKNNGEGQQMTIFYDGKICVCQDVTELQARSIIWFASKKRETNVNSSQGTNTNTEMLQSQPLCTPTYGLSMKRSLREFLQKRRNRIQAAASPYHHH